MDTPPFPGFRKQAFTFLKDLKENNERDWFKPRKETFDEELMWPLRCLVADVAREFSAAGIPLTADPKKSLFRIYRDTRFSKNKDPYKTHVAAVLSRSGTNKDGNGIYIHVEPGNCFLGSGLWGADSKTLLAVRNRMVGEPDEFKKLANYLEKKGTPISQYGEGLKRLPRGFNHVQDEVIGEFLRMKSFVVSRKFTQKDASSPKFTKEVVKFTKDVTPFLDFLWSL